MFMVVVLIFRDVDGAIVRPLPRAKRMLSEATCLPHIVQVKYCFVTRMFQTILVKMCFCYDTKTCVHGLPYIVAAYI